MKKVLSLILALAVLLACAVLPAGAEEGPVFPDMIGEILENTGDAGGIGLMDMLGGFFGGFGNNTVTEEDSDSYSEGIITSFDGTFWESGDLKMEICYQDGYYKVAILEDGTELSYLCAFDEIIEDDTGYGRLTGIGTGDPETDGTQPDHGQTVFIWNYFTEEITWQRESGEIVFMRIIDPLDGSKWVGNGKTLTVRWLGDADYELTIGQPYFTEWRYQCVLNEETDTLEGTGEKTEFNSLLYDGAHAVFAFNENRTGLIWTDDQEPDAAEGFAFEAVARDLTNATWRSGNLVLFILQPDGFGRYDLNVFEETVDEEMPETEEETEEADPDEVEQTVYRYLCTYDWETGTFTSIDVSGIDPETLNYYMDLQEYSGSATFVLEDDDHIIWRDDSGLTGDGVVLEREGS